jgi:hypothetical protein
VALQRFLHLEVAHVDAVQREEGHLRRVAARGRPFDALEHLVQPELGLEVVARLLLPVVEVARDDQRALLRHRGADALGHPLQLEAPAARPQAEVHVDAVHPFLPAFDLDLAVQQPAALDRVVRDVDVLPHRDGMAADDRVAVVAVLVHGVHAVHAVLAVLVGEELVLRPSPASSHGAARSCRPCPALPAGRRYPRPTLQPVPDAVQHQALVELRQALVDVVRDYREALLVGHGGQADGSRSGSSQYGAAIAPRKDALGGLPPGQPHRAEVLARAPP